MFYIWVDPLKPQIHYVASEINPLKFQPQRLVQTTLDCHLPKVADPFSKCLLPHYPGRRTIYVVGDSHASNHVPSILRAASQFKGLEVRYLIEWGVIHSLLGVPKCRKHSNRPCIDDGFDKLLDFFDRHLKPRDIVVFSWARDRVVHEGPIPRKPNEKALRILRPLLVQLRDGVTSRGADFVLVEDIPKPCNNQVSWQVIYVTGKYELCSTTLERSRKDREPLSKLYKSLQTDNVYIFDPHDALCTGDVCGIYNPIQRTLIYAENSPHFTLARPSPLVKEWATLLSGLLAAPRKPKAPLQAR